MGQVEMAVLTQSGRNSIGEKKTPETNKQPYSFALFVLCACILRRSKEKKVVHDDDGVRTRALSDWSLNPAP